MDEDSGVKAPVTRLRRRLSVESDDLKSPSAPSTPTKKRGGRLAVKPQLDLIEENTPVSSPKRTRNSVARDLAEPNEEKPLTPSRRSTRIKSNTSIMSETALTAVETPRAMRAARRTSLLDSDSEAPLTPTRTTRRTRKDSSSNIDNKGQVATLDISNKLTEKTIIEEPDSNTSVKNLPPENSQAITKSIRKSPRLKAKIENADTETSHPENSTQENLYDHLKSTLEETVNSAEPILPVLEKERKNEVDTTDSSKNSNENNLSMSSSNLIKKISDSKKKTSNLNKSMPTVDNSDIKSKRGRTKSWSSLNSHTNETGFYSDTEAIKKNKKKVFDEIQDAKHNQSSQPNIYNKAYFSAKDTETLDKSLKLSSKEKRKQSENSVDKSYKENDNIVSKTSENLAENEISVAKLLTTPPKNDVFPTIFIEEDSSSMPNNNKSVVANSLDCEDQCVPVIQAIDSSYSKQHQGDIKPFETENTCTTKSEVKSWLLRDNKNSLNDSCEPMDIDVTIPENKTIPDESKTETTVNKSQLNEISSTKDSNKSKKSLELPNIDSKEAESKDIGPIKSEINASVVRSEDVLESLTNNDMLSKSIPIVDPTSNKKVKNNTSLNEMTKTPLQLKHNIITQKIGMLTSTPVLNSKNANIKETDEYSSPKRNDSKHSRTTSSSEDESDEDESNVNKLVIDEAEEASDDYESGDSRDDEERQYEKENEIKERGETLTSEDEISTDSDYEKDSFVVTSDEDDNILLSGSGDDLDLSDNELSMSTKSKKKYNDRSQKEQKKASHEMFEARHSLSTERLDSNKKKRLRLDSTQSSQYDSDYSSKNQRRRLDSSRNNSKVTSEDNESVCIKKKKTKRLSESICSDNATNENEITNLQNDSNIYKKDPLSLVKQEPETSLKDLEISSVTFAVTEEVEEVQVNENVTIVNQNETSDPLQNDSDYGDSLSENEEIKQNYDSVLKDLNKVNRNKKIKTHDTSLSFKKEGKPTKEPIVDQLNLTETKSRKQKKNTGKNEIVLKNNDSQLEKKQNISISKQLDTINNDISNNDNEIKSKCGTIKQSMAEEESAHSESNRNESKISLAKESDDNFDIKDKHDDSDDNSISLDLKLIFSDSSNDVEDKGDGKNKRNIFVTEDKYIPLKRTEAKTNIFESLGDDVVRTLNTNDKTNKKKKRKSSETFEEITPNGANEFKFFIDTKGATDDLNVPLNKSHKSDNLKEKNMFTVSQPVKSNSVNEDSDDAPIEISYKSNKNENVNTDEIDSNFVQDTSLNTSKKSKKKNKSSNSESNSYVEDKTNLLGSKKRKRKASGETSLIEGALNILSTSQTLNDSTSVGNQNKKMKISQSSLKNENDALQQRNKSKRKERENDDCANSKSKIIRLPSGILNQLPEKPTKETLQSKKSKLTSTTPFVVEETTKRKNKPSQYLEETIYLNDTSSLKKERKAYVKKPKVLPFTPTAVISDKGCTTKFQINVIPQETKFVALPNKENYKNDNLYGKRIKRMGTYELYKKHRNIKSKF